jgi:hypothetical protein
MPSYYDSSKKKPGKAAVKYAKGGETTLIERADLRQNRAKGGLVRVRGMGAATRGGNFTRNG